MKNSAMKQLTIVERGLAKAERMRIVLDSSEDAVGAATTFLLRAYRGRADLAKAVTASANGAEIVQTLESIRTALFGGDLGEAERKLAVVPWDQLDAVSKAEFLLEKTRLELFSGDFLAALASSAQALESGPESELTRITLHQLRGDLYLRLKQHDQAIEELMIAIALADLFPNAGSAVSAQAFLAKAYCEKGRRAEAERVLAGLRQFVDSIENDELWIDRLLTVLRAQVHFHRTFGSTEECRSALTQALEIAQWLGDETTVKKCEDEMAELPRSSTGTKPGVKTVLRFSGWSYLPEHDLVLTLTRRKVTRLRNSPVAKKLLLTLGNGPCETDKLFEAVWELSYHPERHYAHLHAILSKLRKHLPKGSLNVSDGVISLN